MNVVYSLVILVCVLFTGCSSPNKGLIAITDTAINVAKIEQRISVAECENGKESACSRIQEMEEYIQYGNQFIEYLKKSEVQPDPVLLVLDVLIERLEREENINYRLLFYAYEIRSKLYLMKEDNEKENK